MPRHTPSTCQKGVSLIELLVSMLIGLLILGGVGGVFLSTRETNSIKNHIDSTIEAFRHGSYFIARYVRNAQTITAGNHAGNPYIDLVAGPRSLDCFGNPSSATIRIQHDAASGRLLCDSNVILEHIHSITFECVIGTPSGSIVPVTPCDGTVAPTGLKFTIATRRDGQGTSVNTHTFVVAIRDELYKP